MASSRPHLSTAALPESRRELLRLCCAMCAADAEHLRQLVEARGERVDWVALIDVARSHRLEMLLHRAVDSLPDESVDAAAREVLRQRHADNQARCKRLSAELVRLMDRLASEQIPALAYKGPVLGAQLYGDVAARTYSDLDLLIGERDADAAVRALLDMGYKAGLRLHWEMSLDLPSGESVDLHWSLAEEIHQFPRTTDEMLARRNNVDLAGHAVPTLCAEDTLLAVCFNGFTEDWQRCDRVADVAEILRQGGAIDWPGLLDLCARRGCERIVLLALHLAKELFLAKLPECAELRLQAHRKAIARAGYAPDDFLDFVIASTDRRQGSAVWRYHLRMRESHWGRIPYYQSIAYGLFKPKADDAPWLRTSRQVLYQTLRLPLLGIKHALKALGHAGLRETGHRP
jgi:hypothetical protein